MARIGVDAGGVLSRKEASAAREATPAVHGAVWGMRTLLHLFGHDSVFIVPRVKGVPAALHSWSASANATGCTVQALVKQRQVFIFLGPPSGKKKTMPRAETRKRDGDEQRD